MSLSGFIKLTIKAFKFVVARPMQRYNIYNRSKKYLGPDAKYFAPAPRAIGALSQSDGKPIQYPHLTNGYKSINQKRIEALAKGGDIIESGSQGQPKLPNAYSESIDDDSLVIDASNQLEVTKTVVKIEPPVADTKDETLQIEDNQKKHRPLPKCTNLPLQDPASIWVVDKTPPGRINVNQLQEIMINKLGDDKYWTPKEVAKKYKIKEEYAASLFKYLKQIRIVVSPRLAKNLDYVGMNDPYYQSAKHLIYHVDNRLRNDVDKQFDDMFLPDEELDEEVKKVLGERGTSLEPPKGQRRVAKRPEPLRLSPLNKAQQIESTRRLLQQKSSIIQPGEKIPIDVTRKQSP